DAVAIADRLKGAIDSLASTAAPGVLAAQRRGRAGATLGELRQRAVLVVFWGVDPGARYPRYCARYAVDAVGLAAPGGRTSRRVIAVDVGEAPGAAATARGRMRCSRGRRGSRSRWTSDAGTRRTGRTRARPSGWRGARWTRRS